MKNIILIFTFFLGIGYICQAQNTDKCKYLIGILSIDKISNHLQLNDGKLKTIRIVDESKFFKKCNCDFKAWYIGSINVIPVDLNTGRSIDIVILKIKKKRKLFIINFIYSLSGQLEIPNLWSGSATFSIEKEQIVLKEYNLVNVQ
jgi:hypothetical protein